MKTILRVREQGAVGTWTRDSHKIIELFESNLELEVDYNYQMSEPEEIAPSKMIHYCLSSDLVGESVYVGNNIYTVREA